MDISKNKLILMLIASVIALFLMIEEDKKNCSIVS